MTFRRKFTLLLTVITAVFGVSVPLAFAQQSGIKIQPSIIEQRVDPAQSYSLVLKVTNLGTTEEIFYFSKRDISGVGPEGRPIFTEVNAERTGFESSDWIAIGVSSIAIPAGQERAIPFTITVPAGMEQGSHFSAILVTTNPSDLKTIGTSVGYGASTILALRVGGTSGNSVEEVNIREFRTNKILYGNPEVTFITKVANIGNTLLRPRGPLEITDSFGRKVATLNVNPEGGAVLPKGERIFTTTWQGQGLYFGRYQVVMSLGYGETEQKTVSQTLAFWVLPTTVIVPTLGSIIVIIILTLLFTRFYIRRKISHLHRDGRVGVSERLAKKNSGISLPALVAIALLTFSIIFLMILFLFFA